MLQSRSFLTPGIDCDEGIPFHDRYITTSIPENKTCQSYHKKTRRGSVEICILKGEKPNERVQEHRHGLPLNGV